MSSNPATKDNKKLSSRRNFSMYLPPELKAGAKALAKESGMTLEEWARAVFERGVRQKNLFRVHFEPVPKEEEP